MRIPRQVFTVTGAFAVLTAISLGGASFSLQYSQDVHAVGDSTPIPDPTADPCDQQPAGISAFGEEVCETPTEETLPKTHTPTPEPTGEPTSPPATEPAATNTTVSATSTPSGGAGAGGLRPPDTGSNGNGPDSSLSWILIVGGLALAAGGTGALGYGLRKN